MQTAKDPAKPRSHRKKDQSGAQSGNKVPGGEPPVVAPSSSSSILAQIEQIQFRLSQHDVSITRLFREKKNAYTITMPDEIAEARRCGAMSKKGNCRSFRRKGFRVCVRHMVIMMQEGATWESLHVKADAPTEDTSFDSFINDEM